MPVTKIFLPAWDHIPGIISEFTSQVATLPTEAKRKQLAEFYAHYLGYRGAKVEVVERKDSMFKVRFPDGYVASVWDYTLKDSYGMYAVRVGGFISKEEKMGFVEAKRICDLHRDLDDDTATVELWTGKEWDAVYP